MTTRELITSALRAILATSVDKAPTANEVSSALDRYNLMLDSWSADELMPFDFVRVGFALTANKSQYTIVNGNAADADGICASQTPSTGALTINGALASGGSVTMDKPRHVVVVSTGDESARKFTVVGTTTYGDYLSEVITGANIGTAYGKEQFNTVTSVTIDGNATAAVTVGTDSVVSVRRPVNILSGFVRDSSGNDHPVYPVAREVYNEYPDKDATSSTLADIYSFNYDLAYPSGEISIYKTPSVSTFTMYLDCWLPFEKPTMATIDNAINLPGEYIEAALWNLAYRLGPEFGKIKEMPQMVIDLAKETRETLRLSAARRPKPHELVQPRAVVMGQPAVNGN